MKKIFAILAVLCLLMASTAMAYDEYSYANGNFNDYSEQMQGGLQIYVENPAISFDDAIAENDSYNESRPCGYEESRLEILNAGTALAASADILAGQVSFQMQDNGAYGYVNVNRYDYSYHSDYNDETADMDATFVREGQTQEWLSTQIIDTGFGQVQMQQHGVQNGSNVTINMHGNIASVRPALPDMPN